MPTATDDSTQAIEYDGMGIAYIEGPAANPVHVYRASAVGSCLRALVAALLGYEEQRFAKAEKILMQAAKEGNLHEQSILDELHNQGWSIEGSQAPVSMRVIPGVLIRGHVDGFAAHEKFSYEQMVVEAKTMSDDRFKTWKESGWQEFRKYAWQISAYMKATGLRGLYAIKNRNSGELITFILDEPPVEWKTIRKHLLRAEHAFLKDELPPCDDDLSAGEKFFCPYVHLHDDALTSGEDDEDIPLLDDVTGAVVANLAEQHHDLSRKIKPLKGLEDRRREINKQLEPHVQSKKVKAGRFEVTRIDRTTNRLDLRTLAEDLGITQEELKARYERPYKTTYFRTFEEKEEE
jgi:hypothetical protein